MRKSRRAPLSPASASKTRWISAHQRGALAEEVVADYLTARGFHLFGQNVRIGHFELDIVARQHDLVIVVEVRHRGSGSWQSALESIDRDKIRRIRAAGERLWSERFASDPSVNRLRYDIATVAFEPSGETIVEYFEGAF